MPQYSSTKILFIYSFMLSFLLSIHPANSQSNPAAYDLSTKPLITEIYYDAVGIDESEEWVELYNAGQWDVDLSGYKLGDEESWSGGESILRFPDGSVIPGETAIIIAQRSSEFRENFGRDADFEVQDSDPLVPEMSPYRLWVSGDFRLANDGDEVVLLDEFNTMVDIVAYGTSTFNKEEGFRGQPVPGVPSGQSIERIPADCDTDSALEWHRNPSPAPGMVKLEGICPSNTGADDGRELLPIGLIQGKGSSPELLNHSVSFQAIVTGIMEDQNEQGIVFYSLFVQDIPGTEDGDDGTSDGMAIFLGTERPGYVPGDLISVTGELTEYFGLTELDNDGLTIELIGHSDQLPEPLEIIPPGPMDAAEVYLERFEGMLVKLPLSIVIGPTHVGCGFSVIRADSGRSFIHHDYDQDSLGLILGLLNRSDISCEDMPLVNSGDRVLGISGPLTYHFERFKIVYQDPSALEVDHRPIEADMPRALMTDNRLVIASFNLNDFFETGESPDVNPMPISAQLTQGQKMIKLTNVIGTQLGCPAMIGVQEIENRRLLELLAESLAGSCGFLYQIAHRESPDSRHLDVAFLYNPGEGAVAEISLRQACSDLQTAVEDPGAGCSAGQYPLFSRPPLEIRLEVGNERMYIFVNHFKSKRGGDVETAGIRQRQAEHLAMLTSLILEKNPTASIIVMGDFNDYELSPIMETLTKQGRMLNGLESIPKEQRYSYIFDGERQLLDWILVSPSLKERIMQAEIVHLNADYSVSLGQDFSRSGLPLRSSDHDIPIIMLERDEMESEGFPTAVSIEDDSSHSLPTRMSAAGDRQGDSGFLTSYAVILILAIGILASLILLFRRRKE